MEDSTVLDDFSLENQPLKYAGFWERFGAALIDGVILQAVSFILSMVGIGVSFSDQMAMADPDMLQGAMMTGIGVNMIINWLYYAYQESSEAQATIGKRALGLRVVDTEGDRVSFMKATGRHFGKIVSTIILFIGYIMQPFTERKQALHDIMAGTLVVK